MLGMPRMFGVLAGTVGGDYTGESCHDYCLWVVGINLGFSYQVCNEATHTGVGF